jgi:hypothetical protein
VRIVRKEAAMARQHSSTVFHFSWEEIYMAALMETDSSRLPELMNVAAGTLLDRLLVLTASRGNEIEVGAVEDALGRLAVHKRENDSASRAKEAASFWSN